MASVYFDPAVGGNGSTVSDDSNPSTGLANGGHRTRFVPALSQTVAVAANTVTKAQEAAASASIALNAPGTSATSATSLTIGTGSKSFTLAQTGKAFSLGQSVIISNTASPSNWMAGAITAFNSGTGAMTVNVLLTNGSGTVASWTISLTAPIPSGTWPITAQSVADGAVTTAKILDANVTSAKLAAGAVTTAKIADANITAAKLSGAQSGTAPAYAARAWVSFNGTGTVAIYASGNVSSINDFGVGNYRANFITAMPDANFTAVGSASADQTSGSSGKGGIVFIHTLQVFGFLLVEPPVAAEVDFATTDNTQAPKDFIYVNVAIFR
jgi:hypothetical protein